jgi:hypothetical protein
MARKCATTLAFYERCETSLRDGTIGPIITGVGQGARRRIETMTIKEQIVTLAARMQGLKNDARYWDLCRTYGDYSAEVLRHL